MRLKFSCVRSSHDLHASKEHCFLCVVLLNFVALSSCSFLEFCLHYLVCRFFDKVFMSFFRYVALSLCRSFETLPIII